MLIGPSQYNCGEASSPKCEPVKRLKILLRRYVSPKRALILVHQINKRLTQIILLPTASANSALSTSNMARRKAAASAPSESRSSSSTEAAKGVNESAKLVVTPRELEPVKVNNANAAELKIACDDAVRRVRVYHSHVVSCLRRRGGSVLI